MKKTTTLLSLSLLFAVSAIAQDFKGYQKAKSGVYYKFYSENKKGKKPQEGDIVSVVMCYKNNKDSVVFDSRTQNPNGGSSIEFALTKPAFKGSFEEALTMMAEGDSASFKINADSIYLKSFMTESLPSYIEKGSMLTFEARLKKFTSAEAYEKEKKEKAETSKAEETKLLDKFLKEQKITEKPTASGLYYVEKTKGTGPRATAGTMVKVNYTGTLLNGDVFDTSDKAAAQKAGIYNENIPYEPIEFELGVGNVIPGFDEGLALMNAGGKARLIIPSALAYGETAAATIPPYSTLVFDVEIVSIKSKAEAEKEAEEAQQKALEVSKTEAKKVLTNYLETNKISIKPTTNGLYYIEKVKATGLKPTIGSVVKVNYTFRSLDGKVVKTTDKATAEQAGLDTQSAAFEPYTYPLGSGETFTGFDEGVMMMSAGAKAQLVIPANLLIGNFRYDAPTYEPLVVDVELISFSAPE